MPIVRFPDPKNAGPEGILALGGDLHPDSLRLAYRSGIFPWPIDGYPLAWFCPPKRGILEFERLHIPRRLAQTRRQSRLRFTVNTAFREVIQLCATVPRGQKLNLAESQTWITPEIIAAYIRFHELGEAHSVEAWNGELLVGGLYGVTVDGVFAGESMFHLEANASKLALLFLIDRLRACGVEWMDIQMVTPHMEALGARAIPRSRFLTRLKEARRQNRDLRPAFSPAR